MNSQEPLWQIDPVLWGKKWNCCIFCWPSLTHAARRPEGYKCLHQSWNVQSPSRYIMLHSNTLTPTHWKDAEVKNTSFIIWDSVRVKRRLFVLSSFCSFCCILYFVFTMLFIYLCVVPINEGLTANKVANDSLNVHSKIASKLVIPSANDNDKVSAVVLSWLHYKLKTNQNIRPRVTVTCDNWPGSLDPLFDLATWTPRPCFLVHWAQIWV